MMGKKKVNCHYCSKICFSKSQVPKCFNCKVKLNKEKSKFKTRKEYSRNWSLLKKYNISLEEFDALWIVFKGKCCICEKELKLPEPKQGQSLDTVCVDHDHNTGNLRGLLCSGCNKGLGLFKDSAILLQKAKDYLYNEKTCNN